MPGILPMKVIKVGSNSQSRIAQACDRCRSKKIRCDGVRPTCSQCLAVGFECRTSDKLSRRAFPRGYTETLEERVRTLEAEVRELKELLDQKDENIDMLTKLRSNSAQSAPPALPSSARAHGSLPQSSGVAPAPVAAAAAEVLHVQDTARADVDDPNRAGFSGICANHILLHAFKRRIRDTGRSPLDAEIDNLSRPHRRPRSPTPVSPTTGLRASAPPRLVADQLINIYFQEWAPLFPVLHRPSFLTTYETFCTTPDSIRDRHELAQIYLVFSIAARSRERSFRGEVNLYERQWREALQGFGIDRSMSTLQCLVLAQIDSISAAEPDRLQHYRCRAVGLSHSLGLHQNQRRIPLSPLASETRKKAFWCVFALDSLAASVLGLPRLLRDDDVQTEYPVDTDDEYVTEQGFQPPPPGEATKISTALAHIRATRILAKVVNRLYPAATAFPTYDISFRDQRALEDELQVWSNNLAPHLKLQFKRGKPATDTVSSRSPLLALLHQYIRLLIHLPAFASDPVPGSAACPVLAAADAATRILQIVQLLEERKLSFSVGLNKEDLLILCGLVILYHALDLDRRGKLIRDNERSVALIIDLLERDAAPAAVDFRSVAHSVMPPSISSPSFEHGMTRLETNAPATVSKARSRLQSLASRIYRTGSRASGVARRKASTSSAGAGTNDQLPASSSVPEAEMTLGAPVAADPPPMFHMQSSPVVPQLGMSTLPHGMPPRMRSHMDAPNLDYLSFATEPLSQSLELSAKLDAGLVGHGGGLGEWRPLPPSYHPAPAHAFSDPTASASSSPAGVGPMGPPPPPPPADMWRRPSLHAVPPQPSLTYSQDSVASAGSTSNCDASIALGDPFSGMVLPTSADSAAATATSMGPEGYGYSSYDPGTFGQ